MYWCIHTIQGSAEKESAHWYWGECVQYTHSTEFSVRQRQWSSFEFTSSWSSSPILTSMIQCSCAWCTDTSRITIYLLSRRIGSVISQNSFFCTNWYDFPIWFNYYEHCFIARVFTNSLFCSKQLWTNWYIMIWPDDIMSDINRHLNRNQFTKIDTEPFQPLTNLITL